MMTDGEFQGHVLAKLEYLEKQLDEVNDRVYQIVSYGSASLPPRRGGGLVSLLTKILSRW